jgi:hypothetical protein
MIVQGGILDNIKSLVHWFLGRKIGHSQTTIDRKNPNLFKYLTIFVRNATQETLFINKIVRQNPFEDPE